MKLIVTETEKERCSYRRIKSSDLPIWERSLEEQGRIAKAIRTVVKAASSKSSKKVIVDILQ